MKNITSNIKKLTAGVLTVGIIVAGIVVAPKEADATGTVDATTVICEAYTDTAITEANYWTTDSQIAPVKEGYVFGGWFKAATTEDTIVESLTLDGTSGSYAPLDKQDMTTVLGDGTEDTLYAKFVPAQVLSVKAQNSLNVTSEATAAQISTENPMYIRVISSLDSTNYQKWGFDIYLANKTPVKSKDGGDCVTTKCYDGVLVGDTGTTEERSAESIFGAPSDYAFVWQLSKINYPSNVSKIIYVRPYWYTMDGTKVLGLAKYVHIEDEYKDYISVPINLLGREQVAAGALNLTYDNTSLKLVGFEAGRILPNMNYSKTGTTIRIIGNTDTAANKYNEEETIYANLRFEKPTTDTTFKITGESQFCDWSETLIDVKKVWDTKYVQETTGE